MSRLLLGPATALVTCWQHVRRFISHLVTPDNKPKCEKQVAARAPVVVRAERATWLPGSETPGYLKGGVRLPLERNTAGQCIMPTSHKVRPVRLCMQVTSRATLASTRSGWARTLRPSSGTLRQSCRTAGALFTALSPHVSNAWAHTEGACLQLTDKP